MHILGWDAGSGALSRKIVQRSLGRWDEKYRTIVTICRIWFGYREELHKFLREAVQATLGTLVVKTA